MPPREPQPNPREPAKAVHRSEGPILVLVLVVVLAGLPPALYGFFVGGAPSLSPAEAHARLSDPAGGFALVDVRDPVSYSQGHLAEAVSWALDDIARLSGLEDVPALLRGRSLLLVCDGGLSSAIAARILRRRGVEESFSVRGGLQAWTANLTLEGETIVGLPRAKALVLLSSLYAIKPLYMALASWLLYALRKGTDPRFRALRASLVSFLVGEAACWVNFQLLRVESAALEYVHSASMVLFIALLAWVFLEALDRRVLRYSDPAARCALLGVCRGCRKQTGQPCALARVMRLGTVVFVALALLPLGAPPSPVSYNVSILGFVRNLMHPLAIQLYEIRFAPVAAFVLLLAAFLILLVWGQREEAKARILIAAGAGHLGFSVMRLALLSFFRDDLVWFVAWEEWTELLMIGAIAYILWAFRVEGLNKIRSNVTAS